MIAAANVDVLVVGLGPAGAAAAAAAARAGLAVAALDRKRTAGEPVQCAELVPAMIDRDLAGLHQSIGRMITYVGADAGEVKRPFPGHIIDRAVFDQALVHSAIASGAVCRFDSAVKAIGGDGTVITKTGVTLRPRVLIGADGPHSIVGKASGRMNSQLVYARQIRVALAARHDATDIFLSDDTPGGYGWLFPRGACANVGVGVDAAYRRRLRSLLRDLHLRLLREGRVGAAVLGETGGAIPAGGPLRPHARLGSRVVLLAGDAAGLANPVTGAGIHAALVSGRLAGEAAAAWLGGDAAAARDYADEIDQIFGRSLRHALARRRRGLDGYAAGQKPASERLRDGWIAYPGYWTARSHTRALMKGS